MLHDRISQLIGAIYEAPHEPDIWHRTADEMREVLGCRALMISAVDARKQSLSMTEWYGREERDFAKGIDEYRTEMHSLDISIGYAAQFPEGRTCNVLNILTAEELATSPYMRWYRDRFKSPYFVVNYSPPTESLTFGLSAHPGFEGAAVDWRLFDLFFNHMARSVALATRPPIITDNNEAVIFVRSSGEIVALSTLAEQYLAEQDGLRYENGFVLTSNAATTAGLNRAIYRASVPSLSGDDGTAIFVSRPSARRDWFISVMPLPALPTPIAAFQAKAVIKIVDPSRLRSLSEQVSDSYGFTSREHEIAGLLINGHSPASVAKCLGISENTVKVHLQAIFRKTLTTRQVDLVQLLSSLSYQAQRPQLIRQVTSRI